MYTSLVLFALTGLPVAEMEARPSWHADYCEAKKLGAADKKPVAVFVASGKDGWEKLARGGSLTNEQKQVLASNYVCVHVDSSTEEGKRWASALSIANGKGLVISDFTGQYMAFHHSGDLPAKELTHYLHRYADPERMVRVTEVDPSTVAPAPRPQVYSQPISNGRSC